MAIISYSANYCCFATVGGGTSNSASGVSTIIGGGVGNSIGSTAAYASIGGGCGNSISVGSSSTIAAGNSNLICSVGITIGGGQTNYSCGSYSTIAGGMYNCILEYASTIGGGCKNRANGRASVTSGGFCNSNYKQWSAIPGGAYAQIGSVATSTFGFGSGSEIATPANTDYDCNLEFKVTCTGSTFADGAYSSGGADYAESFESFDCNCIYPGQFVSFYDYSNCICVLSSENSKVLGITSHTPSINGDSKELRWSNTFILDELGKPIEEEYTEEKEVTYYEFTLETYEKIKDSGKLSLEEIFLIDYKIYKNHFKLNEVEFNYVFENVNTNIDKLKVLSEILIIETNEKTIIEIQAEIDEIILNNYIFEEKDYIKTEETIINTLFKKVVNPDKDNFQDYIPREQRPEWSAIGLLGKLWVYLDSTSEDVTVGQYIKPTNNGKATLSTDENDTNRYYVLEAKTFENGTVNPEETSGRLVRVFFK